MKFSEDKISHLAHVAKGSLEKLRLGKVKDASLTLKIAKQTIIQFAKIEEEIDSIVRKKLQSYSHRYVEGSRDWEILYNKHFEEEFKKKW